MTPLSIRLSMVLFSAVLTLAAPAGAQQSASAVISGQVVDETGGVLPGASVSVRDAATGRERSAVTDATGRFSFQALRPGPYVLTVTLSGFETLSREAVNANGRAWQSTAVTSMPSTTR